MQEEKILTPLQARRKRQKGKFIADFKAMRQAFEHKGEHITTEALCRMFCGKYQKSTDMLRRYLKEANVI